MRCLIMMFFLWFVFAHTLAQTNFHSLPNGLEPEDTLYVNFCIASGEFARVHRGFLFYKKENEVFGKFVLYSYGILLEPNKPIKVDSKARVIPLEPDSIVKFYTDIKASYFVVKNDWKLDGDQLKYLNRYLMELGNFKSEGNSNAPDYYTILRKKDSLVVLDKGGRWNKFLEFNKVMKLFQ